jgi:aspartyl-tRNA(Asn)/glutamyl-tRNA(Gln) amidotransferase subunit A
MAYFSSASDAYRQIFAAEAAASEVLHHCLAAIDRHEERIHAWVVVAPTARADAERLDAARARGETPGPLAGIPVGIKDIIDVAGLPTRAGSPLRDNQPAPVDAPLVARLRQAGAILLGKTVTTEFACFDPSPTRNPWDPQLRHTPGGSSSGSAAAVAAGMCLAAIGTQTGGSLVRPASYCGVAAIKPTYGTVPCEGIVPVAYHLDHPGPIARTAEDLEMLLGVLSDLPAETSTELPRPPRLGLVRQFFFDEAEPQVLNVVEAAVDKLRRAGATIEDVNLPATFDYVHCMHRRIMAVEAAAWHRRQFSQHRDSYGPTLRSMLDEGLATTAVDYAEALACQRQFRAEIGQTLATVDALLMPATDTTAPARLDTTGDSKFQAPWSFAGVPVVSIPCGLAADRMPVALQLAGRHRDDFRLLRIARWCEQPIAFTELPPFCGDGKKRCQNCFI